MIKKEKTNFPINQKKRQEFKRGNLKIAKKFAER